ncbi:Subtilisin-like protease [Sphaceloma murrayae]|uniref:Subtilisin-like protease n=1 Tax=Sphaceloma murrayae TaxID=2082308 RepID=A0A2K1QI21_9PEZI|nr:Subtilisin-like protease [Sphaceloma murrayae]
MRSALILSLAAAAMAAPTPADDLLPRAVEPKIIQGKWIVKLKSTAAGDVASFIGRSAASRGRAPTRTFEFGDFKGFAGYFSDEQKAELEKNPDVEYIEPDQTVSIAALTSQSGATWGLGKISHRSTAASTTYVYDTTAGAGTCSYVVDTGIYVGHPDFEGRAFQGVNYVEAESNADLQGHGTHVAGTMGSRTYGVAKQTKLIAVKVCNQGGGCDVSDVVAGLTWLTNDRATRGCPNGSVANLSLGSVMTSWQAVRDAVTTASNNGVFVAVAAGNSNINAANTYPASAPNACTVGSSDSANARSSFSNYGAVVDVFAPGSAIISTANTGTGTRSLSGTSMASPHIAGLAAYLLTLEGARSPVALCDRIKALSTVNALSGVPSGTANRLAYNGAA